MSMTKDGNLVKSSYEVFRNFYHPEKKIRSWGDYIARVKMLMLENHGNMHVINQSYFYLYDAYWMMKNNISFEDVRHAAAIKRERRYDNPQHGARMWFRRVLEVISLSIEPCMSEYNEIFDNIERNLRKIKEKYKYSEFDWWYIKRNNRRIPLACKLFKSIKKKKKFKIYKQMGMTSIGIDLSKSYLIGGVFDGTHHDEELKYLNSISMPLIEYSLYDFPSCLIEIVDKRRKLLSRIYSDAYRELRITNSEFILAGVYERFFKLRGAYKRVGIYINNFDYLPLNDEKYDIIDDRRKGSYCRKKYKFSYDIVPKWVKKIK
jgi:hypothetical protein